MSKILFGLFVLVFGSLLITSVSAQTYPNFNAKFTSYNQNSAPQVLGASTSANVVWQDIAADAHVSGNVGIGTNNPVQPLHIVAGSANGLRLDSSAASGARIFINNSNATSKNADLRFTTGAANPPATNWGIGTDYNGNGGTELNIYNASATRAVSFLQNGNVGIGSTSPTSLLDVQGTIELGANNSIIGAADLSNQYFDFATGDSASGNTYGHGLIIRRSKTGTNNSNWLNIGMLNDTTAGIGVLQPIGTSNSILSIKSDGNVGIGTSAPAQKLQIATGGAYGFGMVCGANGTECLNFNSNGYIYTSDLAGTIYGGGSSVAAQNLWANGDIYLGTRANWLSSYLNQAVLTTSSPTFNGLTFGVANPYITAASYTYFPGGIYVSGGTLYVQNSTQARGGIANDGGDLLLSDNVDVTGNGAGTDYTTAPIEVRTTATPRVSFHWPGVVASQIGMDSGGTIRTYDNPGTGYENFAAKNINANGNIYAGTNTVNADNLCTANGPYCFRYVGVGPTAHVRIDAPYLELPRLQIGGSGVLSSVVGDNTIRMNAHLLPANSDGTYADQNWQLGADVARFAQIHAVLFKGTLQAGPDVAERYLVQGSVEPGDVVDLSTFAISVSKTQTSNSANLFGVVSSNPGVTLGDETGYDTSGAPIALIGRVPVKVSLENGPVHVGDYLTSSSNPGVAMKAVKAGKVIGKALEDYTSPILESYGVYKHLIKHNTTPPAYVAIPSGNGIGKIMVFMDVKDYTPAGQTEALEQKVDNQQKQIDELKQEIEDLKNR